MRPTFLIAMAPVADFGLQAAATAESKTELTCLRSGGERCTQSDRHASQEPRRGRCSPISAYRFSGAAVGHMPPCHVNFLIVEVGHHTPNGFYPGALA